MDGPLLIASLNTAFFGIVMVLVALVLMFALQVFVFRKLKKNAEKLIALSILPEEG